MRANKLTQFALVLSVAFGLALLLSSSCFAYGPISGDYSNTDSSFSASGQYGYYINGNYGRYQSFSGYPPVELITGSTVEKSLFGVASGHTISLDSSKSYNSFRVGIVLRASKLPAVWTDELNITLNLYPSSGSNQTLTDVCSVSIDEDTSGNQSFYEGICEFDFNYSVSSLRWYMTIGRVGTFTYGTDNPLITSIPILTSTGASIYVHQVYEQWSQFSSSDDQSNQSLNNINNSLGDINDSMNDIHQDEKDTIDGAIDDAQDSAGDMDTSGFNMFFPFAPWFNSFTNDSCVSIPIIAGWLHSNETSICTPWDNEVRYYLTPVISVLSTTIIFALLVRWLKSEGVT